MRHTLHAQDQIPPILEEQQLKQLQYDPTEVNQQDLVTEFYGPGLQAPMLQLQANYNSHEQQHVRQQQFKQQQQSQDLQIHPHLTNPTSQESRSVLRGRES